MTVLLAVSLLFASVGVGHGATLNIDHAEAPDFPQEKQIRIFFDFLSQDLKVITGLKPDSIQRVEIDGEEIPGTIELKSFAEAKEWVGVAILMAGHNSFTQTFDAIGTEGGKQAASPSTFDRQKVGVANLIRKLSGSDRVAVYRYDEQGMRQIAAWTGNFNSAADRVAQAEPSCLGDDCNKDNTVPRLYDALKEVVKKVKEKSEMEESFPRRKIVIVFTDGADPSVTNPAKLEGKTKPLVELANDNGVKIYAIGFTDADKEPLVSVADVASSTKGIYREVPAKEGSNVEVPGYIEDVGEEIKKQYVMIFKPDLDKFSGAEKPVKIRVEASAEGEAAGGEIESIKVQQIPTDWWEYVKIVLWVLGGILGLWLLYKIIVGIIRARGNRPVEVYVEDEGPVGPYKGKLTVLEGTYVGAEFYLTEDVTTIGSMDGNTIVLEAPGVSKRHSGIKIEDMRFELADFGSTNGTHVNGNKITKQFLRDQDIVRIGDCRMKFSLK